MVLGSGRRLFTTNFSEVSLTAIYLANDNNRRTFLCKIKPAGESGGGNDLCGLGVVDGG